MIRYITLIMDVIARPQFGRSNLKGILSLRLLRRFAPRNDINRLAMVMVILIQSILPTTQASFDDQQAGARAPGMADAFTAVADDADSISYNPAGLIQLGEGQITTQYGQLVKGLGDGSTLGTTYVGYAHPLMRGFKSLGFAYQNFKADNLFSERTLTLSYGQRLDIDPFNLNGIWSGGVNLKQLHRQYEPDRFTENALNDAGVGSNARDPLFGSGYAKDAYAVDLGGLVQFGSNYQYTAGMALINANQPDVSLGGDGDKAPLSLKTAVAYRPHWGTITAESRRTNRLVGQTDSDLLFGIERNFAFANLGGLIMRGGYGSGSRGFKNITLGLSYLYARFRLDYAFGFPINSLSDNQGTHRIGFSFKMGGGETPQLAKDYSNIDLLAAFAYDSLTTHILLTRASVNRSFTPEQKDNLMLLLMRRYALDDPGLRDVRDDLRDLIRKSALETTDWSSLKFSLVRGLPEEDKLHAIQAMERLVRGDAKGSLARLALLTVPLQRNDQASSLALMALSEVAAQTHRKKDLDSCIDAVRRMVEILPMDEVVQRAYRQLLAQRNKISESTESMLEEKINVQEQLPEAPQTLVAPTPVVEQKVKPAATEFEALVRAFGNSLGYYLGRKAAGATLLELVSLLQHIKATYGDTDLDLSYIDRELANLQQSVQPTKKSPAATPVAAPKKTPVKPVHKTNVIPPLKKAEKPAKATAVSDPEMERAWDYYRDTAARDISDHEKVELLESMLRRFGEKGAARINKELERIRKRLE